MSSVGPRSDTFHDGYYRSQLGDSNATTLKRSQEDSSFDCIPAKRSIMHGMDGSTPFGINESVVETISIPENTVGLVIGRGGSEIQSIQNQSGCRVQMSPDHDSNGGVRQCTLQGNKMAVEKAKQMITEIVARAAQRQAGNTTSTYDARSVTVEVLIPAVKCGLIIGKQGDTIKSLQDQTGCKMMMIQDSQEVTGQPKPLRISGDPNKVEYAQRVITELLMKDEAGASSTRFNHETATAKGEVVVPRSSVGMIIGKAGDTIKRIANETGTKIQFKPDDDPTSSERCAVIMGSRDQIYKATELITDLVNKSLSNAASGTSQETFFMHVPANKTGLVIGKGGETIKSINAESGAHCELMRDASANAAEKVFNIKGTPNQIAHAQHLIRIKVGDIPQNTPFAGATNNGASNGSFPPMGQFGAPMQQQRMMGMPEQWNPSTFPYHNPAAQYAQYQQQHAAAVAAATAGHGQYPAAAAAPAAGGATGQPVINPSTGQPDYSAQWAEYYRSVGLHDQAAMVENQMKQGGGARPAGGAAQPAATFPTPSQPYSYPGQANYQQQPQQQQQQQY